MSFKEFIRGTINYYVLHFQKKVLLLETNGEPRREINLCFEHLSDLYLHFAEDQASKSQDHTLTMGEVNPSAIKVTDCDLE